VELNVLILPARENAKKKKTVEISEADAIIPLAFLSK
jgi:hypothetical protein